MHVNKHSIECFERTMCAVCTLCGLVPDECEIQGIHVEALARQNKSMLDDGFREFIENIPYIEGAPEPHRLDQEYNRIMELAQEIVVTHVHQFLEKPIIFVVHHVTYLRMMGKRKKFKKKGCMGMDWGLIYRKTEHRNINILFYTDPEPLENRKPLEDEWWESHVEKNSDMIEARKIFNARRDYKIGAVEAVTAAELYRIGTSYIIGHLTIGCIEFM